MSSFNLDELFDISAAQRSAMPNKIELYPTFDTHIHSRVKQTGQMEMVVRECLRAHTGIVDIANVSGIKTPADVAKRKEQILSYVPAGKLLQVKVTPLINDTSNPHAWGQAFQDGLIPGVKIFWQGVSNDYGNSISNADAIGNFLREVSKYEHNGNRMLVTLHAECLKDYTGKVISIKNREWWCMQNEVRRLVSFAPELRYVIRHVSDYRTLEIASDLRNKGYDMHVEFSPQYLMLIDDSIFTGDDGHAALQCNCIFWPRPKDARSREKLREAALNGYGWMHIGQDYAMHLDDPTQESGVKINRYGVAAGGLNLLPAAAKSLMIDFFLANGKLDSYERMSSTNPAKLYGFSFPTGRETYVQKNWQVKKCIHGTHESGEAVKARCYLAGQTMHWQRA